MVSDPIADMFVRIKNAQAVNKETVSIPFSKIKQEIAEVLKRKNFVKDFEKKGKGVKKKIEISLLYKNNLAAIGNFKKISKPGQRHYMGWRDIFPVKEGFGISIISTSKGIMEGKDARKSKLGGEVLIEIW